MINTIDVKTYFWCAKSGVSELNFQKKMQAEVSGAKVPSLIVMMATRTQEKSTHQEPGGGAGLSELDGLSCCCSSTVAFWILSSYDLFPPHSLLKQQLVKYKSCFALAELPPP